MPDKSWFTTVWAREAERPSGRDQPALSRDQIVRAAVELLDAEGLDSLSMRKLAARLGSGATSIYWHVASKDELLELVLDEVYGEVAVPDPAAVGWRDAVAVLAYGLRGALVKHPWAITLVSSRPALGPKSLAANHALLKALELAGFPHTTGDYAAAAVLAYVLGATTPEVAWLNTIGRSEVATEEWLKAMRPQIEIAAADYPDLVCRLTDLQDGDVMAMRHLSFDFGLVALLDGLEARLRQA
ncbi:TetR/AcrR family transcriptional regulator [Sphaerisporangium sp. TRM90804]|uniref:TetR/AcrR family transcriptional regulator n=1 Tax=Sphaerisporangium sp. TRM90804 TaxID=3031113 RepID=UPI0024474695|nr:TetR/AcrR family transcriptional regulator [Sphaerisporangium sp. TRM90804]MDH2425262.1 TetR/AcrR family transcriptional regulator [Sphaerisporangium sp. TRM90804]